MIDSDSQMTLPPSVAIIDDDVVQLKLYKSQLTSLGANVTTFESGNAFLAHQDAMWDLIVVRESCPCAPSDSVVYSDGLFDASPQRVANYSTTECRRARCCQDLLDERLQQPTAALRGPRHAQAVGSTPAGCEIQISDETNLDQLCAQCVYTDGELLLSGS